MPLFVARRLFEPRLPLEVLPILRQLEQFDHLATELSTHPASSEDPRLAELRARHERLKALSREHLQPAPELLPRAAAQRAFCHGALLLAHYEATVLGATELVDTCGSKTLARFRADLPHDEANVRRVREALDRAFSPDWKSLDAELSAELELLSLRHDLVAALASLHPLSDPADVHALFTRLYPGHPLREGDVQVVRTGTSLFFPVPIRTSLPGWVERPDDEKQAIAGFLKRARGFEQTYLHHFPVFGFFRGGDADPELIAALAEKTGLDEATVRAKLSTMVSILSTDDLEKYLVHDAWGHQWQNHLLAFEEPFRRMATYGRVPSVDTAFPDSEGLPVSLLDALDGALSMDACPPEHWDRWLRAVFSDRLSGAAGGCVAEALADIVEYKLLNLLDDPEELPSSSPFKDLPLKLDLMLMDQRAFMRIALSGLQSLADAGGGELVDAALEARSEASPTRVARELSALSARCGALMDGLFAPRFDFEGATEGVLVNLHSRIALNTLGFHTALIDLVERLESRDPGPLHGFTDLLMLSVGAFYQADPVEHLWHLDEFVALGFEPLLDAFLQEL